MLMNVVEAIVSVSRMLVAHREDLCLVHVDAAERHRALDEVSQEHAEFGKNMRFLIQDLVLGPQDDSESIAAIRRAVELGINWIDTAPLYGLGHSEEVVAQALDGMAERPYVFTKCGMPWDDSGRIVHNLKRESIRCEFEASLKRLRVDMIDLYRSTGTSPPMTSMRPRSCGRTAA